jgi:benzoylformate decarboxylase
MAAWTPEGNSIVSSLDLAVAGLLAQPAPPPRPAPPRRAPAPRAAASLPMSVAYAMQALDAARQPDDVVVEEAPGSRGVMQRELPMSGADSFYTMASGGLGHGMPAAVGIALARQKAGLPGRVIALIGDGSSLYAIQALYSAVQLALPISFVILNNRRYAALQDFAPVFGYAPGAVPAGTDLPDLDFVKLAEGQGLVAQRVSDPAALAGALGQALTREGPCLLELVVA